MSNLGVMTAEEEIEIATTIARLRRELWTALLAYPPFIDAIVVLVETKISAEELAREPLAELRAASRALRDRETRAHRARFEAARTALVDTVAEADVDNVVSDAVVLDLERVEAGRGEPRSLQIQSMPRLGSRPFEQYVQTARTAARALRDAKNRFVRANLRLVVSIARRYNHGRMPFQDLIQEGNIGLMKAVGRFDHRMGCRFSTYGSWWIRHAITRALADKGRAVRLPVHVVDAHHKLAKARHTLRMLRGQEPTNEELAEHTGMAAAKIDRMGGMVVDQTVSLDSPVSDADGRRVVDLLEDVDTAAPGDALEGEAINEHVREVITLLRPIEADILRKRFGLDDDRELTLKEIGEQYSLSRERIRQLQEQALGKIRQELKRRELV
jgi:RNA polymerase primary sigma factor